MTSNIASPRQRQALLLEVRGVVQGVGFRPFIHRLALRHTLGGWVRNESGQVRIEIEGSPESVEAFLHDLREDTPPLARIESVQTRLLKPKDLTNFDIVRSTQQSTHRQPISPDVAICPACEAELFDPSNRRYRYPFITCTDCGPRFTLIEAMPYDRERTSMGRFTQCPECLREYHAPEDRRYHSETNSCHVCGPRLSLLVSLGNSTVMEMRPLESAAKLLTSGKILAVRGLGGFHLVVDATSEEAVRRLRQRKRRVAKPLAIMVRTLDETRQLGHVDPEEERLLTSRERPIVLLELRVDSGLAPAVAPGLNSVGVMIAYTPLHQLLLDHVARPLVMTSGNMSEEPIACSNADALEHLNNIADAFLLHDREIVARYDDSVVQVADGAPIFLRRARGYAPLPLELPIPTPVPLVAVGPHLKNTFTLAHEGAAYVSQHIGDLENLENLEHFRKTLDDYSRLFQIEPRIAVRDRHPGYLSTRVAEEFSLDRIIEVQHHHAHIAAVTAEHGVTDSVVGVAYDGTGYGDDGNVWGAEVLIADLVEYKRVGHLRYAPLAGGDLAARQPWRAALGYLSLQPETDKHFHRAFRTVRPVELRTARQQIARKLNAPLASSMGRLFDAAAAVLGVRQVAQYEGQAAMELEALAGKRFAEPLPFTVVDGEDGTWVLDPIPLLVALGERSDAGDDVAELAAQFHESVAFATTTLVRRVCESSGIETVALSGGVFQNVRLLESIQGRLDAEGLRVLVPRKLSPNDGAISYGQVAVAAAVLNQEGGR